MDVPSAEAQIVDRPSANVKETLESILVAFILAFIFRCFVVEAFVIPTGSMAPTLLGAHSRFQCPDCGYRFDVNYSLPDLAGRANSDDIDIPDHVPPVHERAPDGSLVETPVVYDDVHCPNCGHRLPPISSPAISYGDRILVLKYMYLLQEPARWDVVVFKSPSEREKDYSINYIKRLVGKPGETIMVLDGDIYVKAKGSDHFEIARKTRSAQEAMWRILYDNDHHPEGNQPRPAPWRQPWEQSTGAARWSTSDANGRVFSIQAAQGSGTLTYHDDANLPDNKSFGFSDWIAYDQRHSLHTYPGYGRPGWRGNFPVSDVKLDLYYSRTEGAGPLKLRLTKLDHAFTAEIGRDGVRLIHEAKGQPVSAAQSAPLKAVGPLHVEFSNADYQVTLRINGVDLLQTTNADYSPDIKDLEERQLEHDRFGEYQSRNVGGPDGASRNPPFPPPTVSIKAEQQSCQISHLSLWRDVYYTPKDAGGSPIHWANFQPVPGGDGGPITLGKDEYFVMGDNSPMSFDARYWRVPIDLPNEDLHVESGRVPERFMLGKAFFVYWPAGFRPLQKAPGIVPNFAQMRFIR